jgi:hypothetical protein
MIKPHLWQRSPGPSPGPEAVRPCSSRRTTARHHYVSHDPGSTILGLLDFEDILQMDDYGHVPKIQPQKTLQVLAVVEEYQHRRRPTTYAADISILKNPAILNAFIQLYFEYFHPVLPLLHKASFNVLETPALLILAVATIGSRFSKMENADRIAMSLSNALRVAIDTVVCFSLLSDSMPEFFCYGGS